MTFSVPSSCGVERARDNQLYLSHVVQGEHVAASIEGMQHQKAKSTTG
jgi:hypothetical protein